MRLGIERALECGVRIERRRARRDDMDVERAAVYNARQAGRLWEDEEVRRLAPLTGAASTHLFAKEVAAWQEQHPPLDVDGMLGPLTLARMRECGPGVARQVNWPGMAPDDAEWLARVTMLEGGRGSDVEWSGIMWVAINRAIHARSSVRGVVATTRWPGGGPRGRAFVEAVQAEGGQGYRSSHGHPAPPDRPQYARALQFAERILAGGVPNPVGPRTHFVHPQSLPRCSGPKDVSDTRVCHEGRAYPRWAVAPEHGGTAKDQPIRLGRAVFS